MCDFILLNGDVHKEIDYADPDLKNGWRNFPLKRQVVKVKLFGRMIGPETVSIPGEIVKGIAIHWIGMAKVGGISSDVAREVMIVQRNRKAFIFSLNLKTRKWTDYSDNLKKPERPHLIGYRLSAHGM